MIEPNGTLQELFEAGRTYSYAKGEIILRAGEMPPGVYYIERGYVKVYTLTDDGVENLHVIYQRGELFPLIWAFKNIVREVFYEALGEVEVRRIPRADFMAAVEKDARVAAAVADRLADQFAVYADRLDNLEFGNAYERVVYRLLFLAGRFGEPKGQGMVIAAPITHQHIADSVNVARETASREIEILEHKGLISHDGKSIVIANLRALSDELGDAVSLPNWGLK